MKKNSVPVLTNLSVDIEDANSSTNQSFSEISPSKSDGFLNSPTRFEMFRKNKRSNPRSVIKKCNEILKNDPDNTSSLYIRSLAYYKLKKYQKSIDDFTKLLEYKPNSKTILYRRGVAYDKLGDINSAIEDFTQILKLDPENINASFYRAALRNRTNNFEEALEDYNNAILLDSKKKGSTPRPNRVMRSQSFKIVSEKKKNKILQLNRSQTLDSNKMSSQEPSDGTLSQPVTPPKNLSLSSSTTTNNNNNNNNNNNKTIKSNLPVHPLHPFSQKINLPPTSNFLQNRYYRTGFLSRKRGYYQKAIEDFERSILARPTSNHSKAYFNIGYCYDKLQNYDEAQKYYTLSVKSDSKQHLAYYNRGIVRDKQGMYLKAIEDFTLSMLFDPENADFYHNRGFSFRKLGRLKDAIADYTIAVEINPKHFKAFHNRGYAYELQGKYKKAVDDYTKALELEPNHFNALRNRGCAYFNSSDFINARKDFENVIEILIEKESSSNNNNDNNSLNNNNNNENSPISKLSKDSKKQNLGMTFNLIGCCFEKNKDFGQSLVNFEKAIELEPNNPSYWYNKASTHRNLREYKKSIVCYSNSLELKESLSSDDMKDEEINKLDTSFSGEKIKKIMLDSNNSSKNKNKNKNNNEENKINFRIEACYYRGIMYRKIGNYRKAIDDLSISLDNLELQNKKDYEKKKMMIKILKHRGFSFIKDDQFEKGVEDYARIIDIDSRNIHAYNNRGIAYSLMNETEKSVADFKRVIELDPNNTFGFFQYNKSVIQGKK